MEMVIGRKASSERRIFDRPICHQLAMARANKVSRRTRRLRGWQWRVILLAETNETFSGENYPRPEFYWANLRNIEASTTLPVVPSPRTASSQKDFVTAKARPRRMKNRFQ